VVQLWCQSITVRREAALQRALEYADSSRHDEADITAFLRQVSARLAIDGELTIADLHAYAYGQVLAFARRLDPGLEDRDFADAGRRLDRWGDVTFAPFGLDPAEVAALRAAFAGWPR
jgi:hypothetical protein